MLTTERPEGLVDKSFKGPTGHKIEISEQKTVSGMWLELPGDKNKSLHLVSYGGQDPYVGYRESDHSRADDLAISVNKDGIVSLQVMLDESNAGHRVLTLDELRVLVAVHFKQK